MTREQILGLPQPIRWAAQVIAPTGKHRPAPIPGVPADQQFARCGQCGGVESAATVHGGVLRCADGHRVAAGELS